MTLFTIQPKRKRKFSFSTALPELMPDLDEFVTTQEAAEKLGYHVNHIRRMVKTGYLVGLKLGHTVLITKKSLANFEEKSGKYQKHDRRKTELLQK